MKMALSQHLGLLFTLLWTPPAVAVPKRFQFPSPTSSPDVGRRKASLFYSLVSDPPMSDSQLIVGL